MTIPEVGQCERCEQEDMLLMDGTLCQDCHSEVWASYEANITRFGLIESGADSGLVAAGAASEDRAVLAWMAGPTAAEVYEGMETVQQVYRNRENLRITYF